VGLALSGALVGFSERAFSYAIENLLLATCFVKAL
jgi:hypothetical protein